MPSAPATYVITHGASAREQRVCSSGVVCDAHHSQSIPPAIAASNTIHRTLSIIFCTFIMRSVTLFVRELLCKLELYVIGGARIGYNSLKNPGLNQELVKDLASSAVTLEDFDSRTPEIKNRVQ